MHDRPSTTPRFICTQAIAKDPKLQRPGQPDPELTEQQEFVYNWINSIDNAEFLKFKDEYKLQVRCLGWLFVHWFCLSFILLSPSVFAPCIQKQNDDRT